MIESITPERNTFNKLGLNDLVTVAKMATALRDCIDLDCASMRAACYCIHGIGNDAIHRLDVAAAHGEKTRRRVMKGA